MPEGSNTNVIEKKEMEPIEVLKHVEYMCNQLEKYAIQARAMIEESKERNISIDLSNNEVIKKFTPKYGEYSEMLNNLYYELMSISNEINTQGVKMNQDDLDVRLQKMEK